MDMYYETERLILRILQEDSAPEVLDFFLKDKAVFEAYEAPRPMNFYTLQYQETLLKCEFQLIVKQSAIRFWIYEKSNPTKIIGTVSLQNILRAIYQNCQIGYKFASDSWHHGYATEALEKVILIAFQELGLHRIEALVHPNNQPSIRLLERLHFQYEGICHSCLFLHSGWTDHLRYSFINP